MHSQICKVQMAFLHCGGHGACDTLAEIRACAAIVENGGHNIWGNPLPDNDKVDVGAHQVTG
jgi:hypothetical protein